MASFAELLETPESADSSPTPVLELPEPPESIPEYNRRLGPRVAGRFIVKPLDGGPAYQGLDLSFGGMMCTGRTPLWPGNDLRFQLLLPGDEDAMEVCGRVVELVSYRERIAMRIRFGEVAATDRQRIAVWMAHAAKHRA